MALVSYHSVPPQSERLSSSHGPLTALGLLTELFKPQYKKLYIQHNVMHLKHATSKHIQRHNGQDMGFSMLSQSEQRVVPVRNGAAVSRDMILLKRSETFLINFWLTLALYLT